MKVKKIAIIDCGIGNIKSIYSAIKYLGLEPEVVKTNDISKFSHIILPGVGSFARGAALLNKLGLDHEIRKVVQSGNVKILGICLGMQLLGASSTEGGLYNGLGLISNKTTCFSENSTISIKIPHVGFNSIYIENTNGIFHGLVNNSDFYFTHSYRMLPNGIEENCAVCNYGESFLAAFQSDNIFGAQFHPEKSQINGLIFLRNFLAA